MFFNVSREKSGRPGRSGDVIGRGLGRGCVSPPTRPRNLLHVCTELESSQHSKMAQRPDDGIGQGVQIERTKRQRMEFGIDVALGRRVARFKFVANSSLAS